MAKEIDLQKSPEDIWIVPIHLAQDIGTIHFLAGFDKEGMQEGSGLVTNNVPSVGTLKIAIFCNFCNNTLLVVYLGTTCESCM